jgi:hypothetical protein
LSRNMENWGVSWVLKSTDFPIFHDEMLLEIYHEISWTSYFHNIYQWNESIYIYMKTNNLKSSSMTYMNHESMKWWNVLTKTSLSALCHPPWTPSPEWPTSTSGARPWCIRGPLELRKTAIEMLYISW